MIEIMTAILHVILFYAIFSGFATIAELLYKKLVNKLRDKD